MIDSVSDPMPGGAADPGTDLKRTRRQRGDRRSPSAPNIDRLPPHDLQMEMGVLGCCLVDPNHCVGECIEKLKDDGKLGLLRSAASDDLRDVDRDVQRPPAD